MTLLTPANRRPTGSELWAARGGPCLLLQEDRKRCTLNRPVPFALNRILIVPIVALLSMAFGQTAAEQVTLITTALRYRDFERALRQLQPALQAHPTSAQLWTLQGLAYSGKEDQEQALASFVRALKIAPDFLPALEGAAKVEYDSGNTAAVPLLEHVLRLHPGDPTSHAMLGVLAYQNGDCANAVQHFDRGSSVIDSQPATLQAYGICLVEVKQAEKAVLVFQRILLTKADNAGARRGLAASQLASNRPQDAITTLDPLMRASDPDVSTMRLAATAYEANKDTPNAVKLLRQAIVKDSHNVGLYVDFANLAMIHQSFQTGIEMIDAGLNLQPKAAELYLARGVLYVQLADYAKAEADFQMAELLDPHQSLSATAQGMIAQENNEKDPDRALATVRAKLVTRPRDPFLWYLQGEILSQKSAAPGSAEFRQALQSATKAVTLQPSLSGAHNLLAKLYLQARQTGLAIKECRLALQEDPADQTALYHLILALRKTNDKTEIPALLKRLAQARQDATTDEAERDRYKLVVQPGSESN
jgi:tetratricopeptide (TPR) repeat protein